MFGAVESRKALILSVIPPTLLIIGMSTVVFFGNVSGYFTRPVFSPQHFSIALNLSPKHHFLLFVGEGLDAENNITFASYNRFPPLGYILIKLVTIPFEDGLSNSIYVAKLLMLAFFTCAAILAYFSLYRLTSNRWMASTAVLIIFSSTLLLQLRYNTTIFTEGGPSFLGFVLTFHGMVIFAQEGRFRQLVVKSCLALLLGWHVLALLFPFVILGLAKEVFDVRKMKTVQKAAIAVVASPYLQLGFITLGFSILILIYNFGNEFYALNIRGGSQLALLELPSIESMSRRTGAPQTLDDRPPWGPFLTLQFERLSDTIIPMSLLDRSWRGLFGVIVVCVCVVGVFLVRHRLLATTAVLAGFCWAIPMRNNTYYHRHEAIYYVGVSLFFMTLALGLASRGTVQRALLPISSVVALMIFALSSYRMSRIDHNHEEPLQETVMEDFDAIRNFTEGKYVFVYNWSIESASRLSILLGDHHFWLNRSSILHNKFDCHRGLEKADFMIETRRDDAPGLLTPDNELVFLYDRYVYEERIDRLVEESEPIVRGDFDVYLTDDRKLVWVGDRCDGTDGSSLFLDVPIFLQIYPVDDADLPDSGLDHEFHELYFIEHFVMDTKHHVVTFDLPDYDVARISTGQSNDEGQIWSGSFFSSDHAYADLFNLETSAIGESIIRGRFNVHLTHDNRLVYVREPCDSADVSERFFVHIFPVDSRDLPKHRRKYDFDNLDFAFLDRGIIDGSRCVAVLDLPDYDIARLRTGQFTDHGPTWQNEFSFTDS